MKGVIVCGGRATRLGPLGSVVSKSLLPVRGKPLVQHAVDTLRGLRVCDEVLLLTGHLGEQIAAFVDVAGDFGIPISPIDDNGAHSTGEAISTIAPLLGEQFLYMHANICLAPETSQLFRQALTHEQGTLFATSTATHAPTHPHVTHEGNVVRSFGERSVDRTVCSVGLACILSHHLQADALRNSNDPLEYLVTRDALENGDISLVDVGNDWVHVEYLSGF